MDPPAPRGAGGVTSAPYDSHNRGRAAMPGFRGALALSRGLP